MGYNTESNNKANKNKKTSSHRHGQQCGSCQKEVEWGVVKGKEGQIFGDRIRFDLWWGAHNGVNR